MNSLQSGVCIYNRATVTQPGGFNIVMEGVSMRKWNAVCTLWAVDGSTNLPIVFSAVLFSLLSLSTDPNRGICFHASTLNLARVEGFFSFWMQKMDIFIYLKLLYFPRSHMWKDTRTVFALKLYWQTESSNEWVDVLMLNSLHPATDTHTLTTLYIIHDVQYFVLSTPPSQQLPDSFIFSLSLHHVCWMVVGIYGYWRGGVLPSLCQLPVCGIVVTVDNR